ncbi:cAMP receptor protein [compost metagenome]
MNSCGHYGDHASCIESVPIFGSLSREEMLEIAHIASSQTFEKHEMVYMAGDQGGTLFVLYKGRVKISRLNANGKEQVIRVLGPGEFSGELSLFSSLPLTDNAQALETSTMCVIQGEKLKELMAKYPSIAFKVLDELSRRLEKAENLIETISLSTVTQRLAKALLELSDGKEEILLNMTKGDLASQIGMSQETLSRKLAALQEEGMIELKGHKRIIIKSRSGLEEMSLT